MHKNVECIFLYHFMEILRLYWQEKKSSIHCKNIRFIYTLEYNNVMGIGFYIYAPIRSIFYTLTHRWVWNFAIYFFYRIIMPHKAMVDYCLAGTFFVEARGDEYIPQVEKFEKPMFVYTVMSRFLAAKQQKYI